MWQCHVWYAHSPPLQYTAYCIIKSITYLMWPIHGPFSAGNCLILKELIATVLRQKISYPFACEISTCKIGIRYFEVISVLWSRSTGLSRALPPHCILWKMKFHYHVQNSPISIPRSCVTFCNQLLCFLRWGVVTPFPKPHAEVPPLTRRPRLFTQYILNYPPPHVCSTSHGPYC
jgi:hypothetical protein